MAEIIYDAKRKKLADEKKHGLSGFMSFQRLVATLTESGEFLDGENLSQVQIDERGLTFVFENTNA